MFTLTLRRILFVCTLIDAWSVVDWVMDVTCLCLSLETCFLGTLLILLLLALNDGVKWIESVRVWSACCLRLIICHVTTWGLSMLHALITVAFLTPWSCSKRVGLGCSWKNNWELLIWCLSIVLLGVDCVHLHCSHSILWTSPQWFRVRTCCYFIFYLQLDLHLL